MKLNTLFVASVCASALFASCNPKTATDNQLKYTHTTLADGDAYHFYQVVGSKVNYELDYATSFAQSANSAQAKQVAAKVKEVYGAIIPLMDSLAIVNHVDFPIKGAERFVAATADSTSAAATAVAHTDEDYVKHVLKQTTAVKTQFERLSNNTNEGLRDFARAQMANVNDLFTLAGGKADAHAKH